MRERWVERRLQFDVCSLELVLEQVKRVANDGVDVDLSEGRAAGAGEVEQAVDDLRGAEGLLGDFVEQRADAFVAAHLFGEHLRIRRDDSERSIDLVRDTGSKQADGG